MRKSIWEIEAKDWHEIGPRHKVRVTFIIPHQLHFTRGPHILYLCSLMYFEGDPLVIFITHLYYLPPHIVIVPWGHASEG